MNDVTSDMPAEIPDDIRYAASHEWARLEDGLVTVGISDFAQQSLGDVVFVELPEVGDELNAGAEACVVESVKAAADVYAPVSGTVVAVNDTLEEAPEMVNQDPYGDGWFFQVEPTDPDELQDLLDADGYAQHCVSEHDEG